MHDLDHADLKNLLHIFRNILITKPISTAHPDSGLLYEIIEADPVEAQKLAELINSEGVTDLVGQDAISIKPPDRIFDSKSQKNKRKLKRR